MELRLKGYGTIEITKATLVEGGDILIEAADNFCEISKTTGRKIAESYLTETEYGYGVVVFLDVLDSDWFADDAIVFDIENQCDVQKLNALL